MATRLLFLLSILSLATICRARTFDSLLGHTKLESTVRYPGIEVEDALQLAEQTEM